MELADEDRNAPPIPPDIEAKQLAPEIRRELSTLDRATADAVARHLVAAGELIDEDPEAALEPCAGRAGPLRPYRRGPRSRRDRGLPLR